MTGLSKLIANNAAWSDQIEREKPGFFAELAKQQAPEYLWIGCSDSRVPANQIIGLAPGEVFVHRNVGNVVVHTDLNFLSVLQFAVDLLKVKHVLVVGHYGCSGVRAALEGQRVGISDQWLQHIRDVVQLNRRELDQIADIDLRAERLCELNALHQATHVCGTSIVRDAWARGQELVIHGWAYSLKNGRVHELDFDVGSADEFAAMSRRFEERRRAMA